MTKAKEMLYPVGVENLFIAFMTGGKDTQNAIPTFDSIYSLPTIETIGIAGNPTTATKWASNKLFVNATKNSTFTLTLDHTALPVEVTDKMNAYIAEKGIVFDKSNVKEYPFFAIGFIAPLNDGSKIARWYPRVQITPPQESFKTGTEESTIPTQQLVMTASPLLFNNVTKSDFNSARDSATGITAEDFMQQVICDESQLASIPGVSVTVTPESASVAAGGTQQLTAAVTGATDSSVTWTSSDTTVATVDATGLVTVDATAITGETATITATSVEDPTKSDAAVITVA
jgi:phi13 family phage major tail protein